MESTEATDGARERRWWVVLLALGFALRAMFLLGREPTQFPGDETRYVYHAVEWLRFGVYSDAVHFQWPPGYSFLLYRALDLFGAEGLNLVRWVQGAVDLVNGACVLWLSRRFFGRGPMILAGLLWATSLPLVTYSTFLRPETFFLALVLPALCLTVVMAGRSVDSLDAVRALLLGVLLGVAAYLRESAIPVLAFLLLGLCLARGRGAAWKRGLSAAVTLAGFVVVLLPWALRNQDVYGRLGPPGNTLGQNLFWSVNDRYQNLDYPRMDPAAVYEEDDFVFRNFIAGAPGEGWKHSEAGNLLDKSEENVHRAWEFGREHPGLVLRRRAKMLADSFTPLSFVVRMVREGWDEGWWSGPRSAPVVGGAAIVQTALLLLLGITGLCGIMARGPGGGLVVLYALSVFSTVPLAAMSRYRLPVEPVLMVAAAGLLCGRSRPWARRRSAVASLVLVALIGASWWLNAVEIAWVWTEIAP